VIDDLLAGALFLDGPTRYATYGTPQQLHGVDIDHVRAYAQRAFRPANAVLVVTGAVDARVLEAAVPGRANSLAGTEPSLLPHPVPQPQPVVAHGTENGMGWGWVGPPINAEREATALDFITDYLFRAESGTVQRALANSKSTVDGKFVTYHDPGLILVTVSGGDLVSASKLVTDALARVQKPLDAKTFAAARDAFVYHILSDIQTPGELADNFGWYAVEGNPDYAPGADGSRGRYFAAAASLTPEFVAQTVAKYLGRPGATVTLAANKTPADSAKGT
jgi:predicted Zn-dependent peptidase